MMPLLAVFGRALRNPSTILRWNTEYSMPPAALYCSGSHYLNLQTSPQKALSFRVASEAFSELPRFAPYDTKAETEMMFGPVAISYARNLSLFSSRVGWSTRIRSTLRRGPSAPRCVGSPDWAARRW